MNPVEMTVENGVLIIRVKLDEKQVQLSQSGKMELYGSTGGFMAVPSRPDVKVNLNVGRKAR